MGHKRLVMTVVLAMLFMAGTAAALDITVLPTSGPNVKPDGTILVPVGANAFESVGLAAEYNGFVAGKDPYMVQVVRNDGTPMFSVGGKLATGNDVIPINWVVPNDRKHTYTVIATGMSGTTIRQKLVLSMAPVEPVPELSTVVLTSSGVIGLLGLVRMRRKD
ncbi:Uncharacterised protein [uncultured archaeon]|nr:Uncharacterised protein [uncultured archaeon]